jgi:hypothetical protein
LLTAAAALTGLTVVGTVGFAVILHESVGDALYRLVNTITTAGEVAPSATAAGRLFTVAVLVALSQLPAGSPVGRPSSWQ